MTNERLVQGFQLLKAKTKAQIALGQVDRLAADAEWHLRNEAFQAASVAWESFLRTPDADFKMKQAGER